ncbi:MAG: McrB family protein [Lachnospiraceae bacterium]
MNSYDRQYIGVLAENGEPNGKNNIFLNRGSFIQYWVKSLLLPAESETFMSGFLSSFDEDCEVEDDEYLSEEERIERFEAAVENKVFIYTFRLREDGFANILKASLIERPDGFTRDTACYAIPVFCSAENETLKGWEEERRWRLFREYTTREEFTNAIEQQQALGSVYGYDAEAFPPSFVIWKEEDGTLLAIGKISASRYNTLGGLILESSHLDTINISEMMRYVVYNEDFNPTLMFIPEAIYKQIEDAFPFLPQKGVVEEKIEDKSEKESDRKEGMLESESAEEEGVIEIATSCKTDELIIQSMDYYSQKQNLFYHMRDLVNFHTAVKCSSLVILSGLSGTGKSALVESYARALGMNNDANPKENRLLFIPVRPSWNDDADLLGYVDLVHMAYRPSDSGFVDFLVRAQRKENRNKLFLVCFDEMNLARVEHYFSQFLSILERPADQRKLQLYDAQYSGRLYNSADYPSQITIGENIRFVGTVNVDESTYHFSDKVLDRANVIQLDVLNYAKEWKKKTYATLDNVNWTFEDYNRLVVAQSDCEYPRIRELLWEMHTLLQTAGANYGVGPRAVKSICRYLQNLPKTTIGGFDFAQGVDAEIAQRVLTKVRGPQNQLGEILNERSERNFQKIFEAYSDLSRFEKSKAIIRQKKKELESYGYCI